MEMVIPKLPDSLDADRGEPIPGGIVNATILAFGTLEQVNRVSGGGLVIDYKPAGSSAEMRAVFAFDETGMWVSALVPREDASTIPDALPG